MKKFFIIPLILLTLLPLNALALNPYSVALSVDNEAATYMDVKQRLQMAMVTSGLEASEENEKTLLPQIVQLIIDEKLYLQEAERLGLRVTDDELNRAISNIEQQNNLPAGGFDDFLLEKNLPREPFVEQLRAQIAWNKVIARKIRPYVSVSEIEIDEKMEYYRDNGSEEELLLSEITLPIDNNTDKEEIRKLAIDLVKKINDGADFAAIARQFSRSSTAENGGEIGWIEKSQLSPDLYEAIKSLNAGEITEPLMNSSGYTILKLHNKKSAGGARTSDSDTIALQQIFVSTKHITDELEHITKQKQILETARNTIKQCTNIDDVAATIENAKVIGPISAAIKDFQPEIQTTINELSVGMPSNVTETSQGLHIFIVCERMSAASDSSSLPDREKVHEQILKKKLMLQARRYLRDLRRKAYIEVRM